MQTQQMCFLFSPQPIPRPSSMPAHPPHAQNPADTDPQHTSTPSCVHTSSTATNPSQPTPIHAPPTTTAGTGTTIRSLAGLKHTPYDGGSAPSSPRDVTCSSNANPAHQRRPPKSPHAAPREVRIEAMSGMYWRYATYTWLNPYTCMMRLWSCHLVSMPAGRMAADMLSTSPPRAPAVVWNMDGTLA